MVHKHAKLVIKKMKQLMLQTLPVYSVQVVSSRDTTILLATIVLLGHTRHSEYVWLVWFPTLSPMVQLLTGKQKQAEGKEVCDLILPRAECHQTHNGAGKISKESSQTRRETK